MYWQELSRERFQALDKSIPVLLNISAIEQHGPSLPVGTDPYIGEGVCSLVNNEMPEGLLILPPQRIGFSEHHMNFQGSLTLSHETLIAIICEIASSVHRQGFHRFYLLNSHGGNQGAMRVAMEKISMDSPDMLVAGGSWWTLCPGEFLKLNEGGKGSLGHAAEFEHSIVQYLYGTLISSKPDDTQIGLKPVPSWAETDLLRGAEASLVLRFEETTHNGIYGNLKNISAEKGRKLLELSATKLCSILREMRTMDRSDFQ